MCRDDVVLIRVRSEPVIAWEANPLSPKTFRRLVQTVLQPAEPDHRVAGRSLEQVICSVNSEYLALFQGRLFEEFEMRYVSLFIVCCLLVDSAIAKEPEVTLFPVQEDDESKAAEVAVRLSRQSPELLKKYVNGKDDSLALCARWSEVRQSKDKVGRINGSQCSRFTGYVEGRLKISVPAGWQQWLHINFDKDRGDEKGRFAAIERIGREHSSLISEESDGVSLFNLKDLAGPGVKVKLPRVPGANPLLGPTRSGVIDGPNVFVADYGINVQHFPLFCFGLDKEKPEWTAKVWGAQLPGGRPAYLIEVTTDEERVFVFGGGSGFSFFEGFALGTGQPLVRFNTQFGE
jgi:hypothetical protein